jgi:hypothetical protein
MVVQILFDAFIIGHSRVMGLYGIKKCLLKFSLADFLQSLSSL